MPLLAHVDFYLLADAAPSARDVVACRLLEKAYLREHRVFVYCADQAQAKLIDELLWTFKDNSFIPHNLQGEDHTPPPPIQIGYQKNPPDFNDILLNLSAIVPAFYLDFQRIIELVINDKAAKELSRAHYRDYRQQGCEIKIHNLA